MAQRILPDRQDYLDALIEIEKMGYRRLSNQEIASEISEKETVSTSVRKGTGMGFRRQYMYVKGTLSIEINTNWSDAIMDVYQKGNASFFVKDSRNPKHTLTSFDIHMSEAAPEKLLGYASSFKDIVEHWPEDPECGHLLMLFHIPGVMHQMYFTCKTREPIHKHQNRRVEVYFTDIEDISEETKNFLNQEFGRNEKFTKWEKSKGKDRIPLRVIRANKQRPKQEP